MADLTPAKRLFDLLVTRDFEVETLDSSGKANPDPSDAEIFSFDFTTSSGNNYGTVVIMYGEDNSLDLYTSDNVGRTMEGPDKDEWFAFQHQLKDFAMRNNSRNSYTVHTSGGHWHVPRGRAAAASWPCQPKWQT